MLLPKTAHTRWTGIAIVLFAALAFFGPVSRGTFAGAMLPAKASAPGAGDHRFPFATGSASHNLEAHAPNAATPERTVPENLKRLTVAERLAKIKSPQELMEKNKVFPMLHDANRFEGSVRVTATGYYAGYESTGKRPGHPGYGITYSGVRARHGILSTIAADPNVFPLGTILYIPGYGYGIVADTGSAIKGYKIDLYFETKEQVYKQWGKRDVNVFIVKKGDGKVSEQTLQQWNDILTTTASGALDALDL